LYPQPNCGNWDRIQAKPRLAGRLKTHNQNASPQPMLVRQKMKPTGFIRLASQRERMRFMPMKNMKNQGANLLAPAKRKDIK